MEVFEIIYTSLIRFFPSSGAGRCLWPFLTPVPSSPPVVRFAAEGLPGRPSASFGFRVFFRRPHHALPLGNTKRTRGRYSPFSVSDLNE